MERWPSLPGRRQSWRWRRSSAAATLATGNGGRSSPECGGAWERHGESEGESTGPGKQGEMDEGKHGGAFYGLGKAGSRLDVAESAGEVGRRRGVVEGLTGADFRGESGGKGGGGGGDRFHALVGRGEAREPQRRGAKPAAMAAVGATGGWGRR
uniref:Uncharacterized protein n=1 Tax=Oryza sativa subsp. japonica TaxID=39947 RepID=Q6YWQ6_ORYSJ|nr:hypothetical protein [Oryza sativa Japonica Group]BAD16362.1 hypothetical protein [Oryza sativa Japonica Group]